MRVCGQGLDQQDIFIPFVVKWLRWVVRCHHYIDANRKRNVPPEEKIFDDLPGFGIFRLLEEFIDILFSGLKFFLAYPDQQGRPFDPGRQLVYGISPCSISETIPPEVSGLAFIYCITICCGSLTRISGRPLYI